MKSNKKRIIIVFAILTMAVVLSCAFVACDKTGSQKSDYKVTVHPNNGQTDFVWDIGSDIPVITKDGYHITGYYLDAEMTISTSFESLKATGLTNNIDIYVKWEEDVCEHVAVTDAAVEPTCTKKGLTEGKHCSVCNKILTAQTEIPALGHDLESHVGQPATCTEKGWEEYVTCKREGCDYTTYEKIDALGHTGGTATCTEQATCERCNEKYGELAKHKYKDNVCIVCGAVRPSEGLEYSLSSDGTGYIVSGIGTCTDKELIIPSEYNAKPVTSIGDSAFYGCKGLTSVTIPDSVKSIGNYAFYNCTGLTSITIGSVVTSIGDSAFEYCYRLIEVYNKSTLSITAGSSSNGYVAYYVKNIYTEEGKSKLTTDENGYIIYTDGDEKILVAYLGTNTELVLPSYITKINQYAFYTCAGLTSVTIPDRVTSIGERAFYNCTGLTSITIGSVVTSIGDYAFSGCYRLIEVYNKSALSITAGRSSNGNVAYYAKNVYKNEGGSKLSTDENGYVIYTDGDEKILVAYLGTNTELTLPSDITKINQYAFYNCSGLTSITIPNGVTSIGRSAFEDCSGLTSIVIPNSVTSIVDYAFYGCTGLTSVTMGNSVTSIYNRAFDGCSNLQDIYITDIAAWCNISGLSNLMKYGASNKKLYINNELVTSITIPDGVTAIPSSAFRYCTVLTSITIPDSVTSIGDSAFDDCSGLTSVIIPDSVTSIGSFAFDNCSNLQDIYITDIAAWCNISGLYNLMDDSSSNKKLYINNELVTSVTIPDGVTAIPSYAFKGCSGLTSVTSISYRAFEYCSGLTSITIPDSVTSIGRSAFEDCSGLTSVYYAGTKEKWSAIKIEYWNSALTSATRYYYSETEPSLNADGTAYDGNFWHYDTDGNVVIWKKEN